LIFHFFSPAHTLDPGLPLVLRLSWLHRKVFFLFTFLILTLQLRISSSLFLVLLLDLFLAFSESPGLPSWSSFHAHILQ
jgi:hypothetical protein